MPTELTRSGTAPWNAGCLRLKIDAESEREPGRFSKPDASLKDSPGAQMFGNRLAKNLKRLQSWAIQVRHLLLSRL